MHPIISFSLIVAATVRFLNALFSYRLYYETKNLKFKSTIIGWLIWGTSAIFPLIAFQTSSNILTEVLLLNNLILTTIGIYILVWNLFTVILSYSKKAILTLPITYFIFSHILYLLIDFELTLSILALISQGIWTYIVLIPLIKREKIKKNTDRNTKFYYIIVLIIGLVYLPFGFYIGFVGNSFGLYFSDNELLISINYGYLIIFSFLITFLIQYLEYKIVNDQKLKLKDKYSHNLGNTLHSIYISVDLLKEKEVDQKDKKILIDMLEDKKKESNDLIKEIREL